MKVTENQMNTHAVRNKFLTLAVLAAMIVVASPSAHATLLSLPPFIAPTFAGNTDDINPLDHNGSNPIGTFVVGTVAQPFSISGSGTTTNGNAEEVVYRESSGTLDFYIQVQVTSGTGVGVAVNDTNTGNFAGAFTEVGTVSPINLLPAPAGTISPTFDTRSNLGDTIQWNYLITPIITGTTSYTMAISTNATNWTTSNFGLLGADGATVTLNGFEPSSVPEPAGIVLFGTASALTAFFFRRRLARKA